MTDLETFKMVVEGMHEGVYFVDLERNITFWNKGAERITGYAATEVLGRSCRDNLLVHMDDEGCELCHGRCPLVESMVGNERVNDSQIYLHHKNGQRVPVLVSVSPIRDRRGQIIGGVELFRENLSHNFDLQVLEELKKAALVDKLTSLPNRRYLEMNLNNCFSEYRDNGMTFGIIYVDIDHFKQVNDTYGHDVGDRILQLVATTMENNMRAYDMTGRWGGEEFLVVVRYVNPEQFRVVPEKLCRLVANSFLLHDEERLGVTVSMGATHVQPDDTSESLLKRADQFLYQAKTEGRNRVVFG